MYDALMQRLPINDVNLRLILSKDHEQWFRAEIRDRWVAIIILLIISTPTLVTAVIWSSLENEPYENIVYVDSDETASAILALKLDGYIVRYKSGPGVEKIENGGLYDSAETIVKIIFIILLIASPFLLMFVVKALLEIGKLVKWRTEHHEFLRSHGRTPT